MPSPTGPQPSVLSPTVQSTQNCTAVSEYCPVEYTIYSYYPNLGANIFFCVFFGLCLLIQLCQGIRYKTWTYSISLVFGCLGEAIGTPNSYPLSTVSPILTEIQATLAESCSTIILGMEMALISKYVA